MNDPTPEYPFFAYFHRAKREGLTDAEAYRYAITEDIYSPDDDLLGQDDPKPMGMCYHPPSAVINMGTRWYGTRRCDVCGSVLQRKWVGPRTNEREIYWAPASKIPTRSETAAGVLSAIAETEARE